MRHRNDDGNISSCLFSKEAEIDIARLDKSRHTAQVFFLSFFFLEPKQYQHNPDIHHNNTQGDSQVGALDWDKYLEGFDLDDPKGRRDMQPIIGNNPRILLLIAG